MRPDNKNQNKWGRIAGGQKIQEFSSAFFANTFLPTKKNVVKKVLTNFNRKN